MFQNIFNLEYERNGRGAVGFYIAYLLMLIVPLFVLGSIVGIMADALKYGTLEYVSSLMFAIGGVSAIVFDVILAFFVVKKKGLLKNFVSVALIGVTGLFSVFGGALFGLLPVAILTTFRSSRSAEDADKVSGALVGEVSSTYQPPTRGNNKTADLRLLNPNDMVRALRGGKVRRWEVVIYAILYIAGLILLTLSFIPSFPVLYTPFTSTTVQVVEMVFVYALLVGEIIYAYYINKSGDGIDFWRRYISLNGALFLPTLMIAFVLGFIAAFFNVQADGVLTPLGWGDVFISGVMVLLLTAWLLHLMHKVSHVSQERVSI